jgi:hypothetical protein
MSKRERLQRWAEVLEQNGGTLRSLYETEFVPYRRRRTMREDNSPLTVAFEDPVLRGQGLKGDTYGDAIDFFELSNADAHRILCYCHAGHTISARMVGERVRRLAEPSVDGVNDLGLFAASIATLSALAAAGAALASFF